MRCKVLSKNIYIYKNWFIALHINFVIKGNERTQRDAKECGTTDTDELLITPFIDMVRSYRSHNGSKAMSMQRKVILDYSM